MSAIQRLAQSYRCSGGQLTDGTARRIGKTAWGGSGAGVVRLTKRPLASQDASSINPQPEANASAHDSPV